MQVINWLINLTEAKVCCHFIFSSWSTSVLRIASVDVTNITIQWDRVDCQDRNGRIDSYVVMYYPTSDPSESTRRAATVSGTGDSDRMFNLPGLPPRTSYTFQVEANNPLIRDPGAVATINVSTTAPQSKIHCNYKSLSGMCL